MKPDLKECMPYQFINMNLRNLTERLRVIEIRIAIIAGEGAVLLTGRAWGIVLGDGYALYFDLCGRHKDVYKCKMSLSHPWKSCMFRCI